MKLKTAPFVWRILPLRSKSFWAVHMFFMKNALKALKNITKFKRVPSADAKTMKKNNMMVVLLSLLIKLAQKYKKFGVEVALE